MPSAADDPEPALASVDAGWLAFAFVVQTKKVIFDGNEACLGLQMIFIATKKCVQGRRASARITPTRVPGDGFSCRVGQGLHLLVRDTRRGHDHLVRDFFGE